MKKTVQVNLSGQIFTLDEDAFELLTNYLDQIGRMYQHSTGRDEIIQDIEARIAELLLEKLSSTKQVITIDDIKEVTAIMGDPKDFEDVEAEAESTQRSSSNGRLYRDPDERVLGGVCSGIGHYFGLDPLWFRLAFIVALIFFGTGILLYIILWAIIPEAKTTTERLEMKGEPVNIGNIGKAIEEEISNLGTAFQSGSEKANRAAGKVGSGIERFFGLLAQVIVFLLRFISKILGVAFSLAGVILVIALLVVLFGATDAFNFSTGSFEISFDIYEISDLFFENTWSFVLSVVAGALLFICPFLLLLYAGILLLNSKFRIPYLGGSLFGLWLAGIGLTVVMIFVVMSDFSKDGSMQDQIPLTQLGISADTITVEVFEDVFHIDPHDAYYANQDFLIKEEDRKVYRGNIEFDIVPSKNSTAYMNIKRSARGRNYELAQRRSDSIRYNFQWDSTAIKLNAYFTHPIIDLIRDQEVEVDLAIPHGQVVYLAPGTQRVIDDIRNTQSIYDPRMVDHYWIMTSEGLSCMDCKEAEED